MTAGPPSLADRPSSPLATPPSRPTVLRRGSRWRSWVAAAAAAALAACGGGEGGGGPESGSDADGVSVRDSAGVEIVENDAPAWDGADSWTVAPEPVLRLGTATGGGAEQFGRVADVAILSDGRIAVADGDAQEVRVFAPDGDHLFTSGGEGGGPGEFSSLSALAVGPGDTLVATDLTEGTLVVFGPDGAFAREVRPETGGDMMRRLRGVFGDGSFVVSQGIDPRSMVSMLDGPSGARRDTAPEFRVAGDGSLADTLGFFPGQEEVGGPTGPRPVFFGRQTHFAVVGDRLLVADEARWEVRVYDPSGRLLRIVRKPHEPVPVRPQDLEARREERLSSMTELLERMPGSQDSRERFLSSVREAPGRETLPAFDGLLAAADGHLWVQEALRPGETPPRWTVLDSSGRWLGTVKTPDGLRVEAVSGDRLAGVRQDELGVNRVEVYEIRKP